MGVFAHTLIIINPRRACAGGYGSCPVCVSVCVSVRNLNLGTGASRGHGCFDCIERVET